MLMIRKLKKIDGGYNMEYRLEDEGWGEVDYYPNQKPHFKVIRYAGGDTEGRQMWHGHIHHAVGHALEANKDYGISMWY